MYKILRNIEDIDYRKFFIRADTVQLRGHNYILYKNRSLKQKLADSLLSYYRTVKLLISPSV